LKRWPDDGQLTETCCHNKTKINIVVFDKNQKTILLSFSLKHNRMLSVKKKKKNGLVFTETESKCTHISIKFCQIHQQYQPISGWGGSLTRPCDDLKEANTVQQQSEL
jgi:hypothetical protein